MQSVHIYDIHVYINTVPGLTKRKTQKKENDVRQKLVRKKKKQVPQKFVVREKEKERKSWRAAKVRSFSFSYRF